MILKAPTGQFFKLLPQDASDAGSVTFTISNHEPPPVITIQAVNAPESVRVADPEPDVLERADYGELIFTSVDGSRSTTGSNRKLFAPGEVIDFADDAPRAPAYANNPLVVQHNLNVLDWSNLGLTEEEVATLSQDSADKIETTQQDYVNTQMDISNLEIDIYENQKAINESRKALRAVETVYGTTENEIYDKLDDKLMSLLEERDRLTEEIASKQRLLTDIREDLIDLVSVVK